MRVWIVSRGAYSNAYPTRVCLTKRGAERVAKRINDAVEKHAETSRFPACDDAWADVLGPVAFLKGGGS